MAQKRYYYKLQEAEELKQTFSSWVNKVAHIGNGQLSVLKEIVIKPKKVILQQPPELQTYNVEFRFTNSRVLDAGHFLMTNGLRGSFSNMRDFKIVYKKSPCETITKPHIYGDK